MDEKQNKSAGMPPPANIDIETLRRLMALMAEHDMQEVRYESGDLSVRLSKGAAGPPPAVSSAQPPPAQPVPEQPPAGEAVETPEGEQTYAEIRSPMVGTFYPAPSPDGEPFVKVGSEVSEDSVVCLIEAMKVFNEIKAGVSGKVVKVCVGSEGTVEYDQLLFLIDPS